MLNVPDFETFCGDPQYLDEPISKEWVTFYRVVDGLALDEEGVELFRACTGRDRYEPRVYTEATGICGRRSEKTVTSLKYLLWRIVFGGWDRQLSTLLGRIRTRVRPLCVPIIAQDMRVAKDIIATAESLVMNSPLVSKAVDEVRVSEIVFKNGISLLCLPASKASVRGRTCAAALLDELAWVSVEGASDLELVRQVKPSLIQFGATRRLIKLSTPWQKSGVLYDEYVNRASRPELLVWQASTATMTPRIPAEDLAAEEKADPSYYRREYLAEFSSDLEAFLPLGDILAAVADWRELAFEQGNYYVAALDASSLVGKDRFTFGICHSDKDGVKVDLLRAWRREAVPQVVDEIASLCAQYGIGNVIGDQYASAFLGELLRQRDIGLELLNFSARSKFEIYLDLKNALAQGKFWIPQNEEAVKELRVLESTKLSGGGYRIAAPKNQHDDFPTVLALLANKIKNSVERIPWIEVLHLSGAPRVAGAKDLYSSLGPNDFGPERWWRPVNRN
jgi:hypothetical protein